MGKIIFEIFNAIFVYNVYIGTKSKKSLLSDIKSLLKSLDCDKLQKFFNAVFTNEVFIILPP